MKKLFLVLLAVALVGSFAFAEVTGVAAPTVTGDSTLSVGYNLLEGASGFEFSSDVEVTVPLAGGSDSHAGSGDVYAVIEISDIDISTSTDNDDASTDDGLEWTLDADVAAKIVMGALYVGLDTQDLTFNYVDLEQDEYDFNSTVAGENGIAIGYMTEAFSVEVGVESVDGYEDDSTDETANSATTDWTDSIDDDDNEAADAATYNTDNGYVFGLNASVMAGPATVALAFSMDPDGEQTAIGAQVDLMAGPASICIPADYIMVGDDFGMDLNPGVSVALEGVADIAVDFLMQTWEMATVEGDYMEATLTFTENAVDMLAAEVEVSLTDLTADELGWGVDLTASYDAGAVAPYLETGYDSDGVVPLTIGANFPTAIDNATVAFEFLSDDVAAFADNYAYIKLEVGVTY